MISNVIYYSSDSPKIPNWSEIACPVGESLDRKESFQTQRVGAQPQKKSSHLLAARSRPFQAKPALFVAPRQQFRGCNAKLYLGRIIAINDRLILTIA
jgi:hypothetical protein